MKTYVPDYYKDFRCLAGDCKHSCCIGWEIDIDEDTLDYYNSVEGEFGKRLKNSISYEGGTPHFCMDKEGRCPFLNEKGLCDIMTNLGFDKVSDICDDHPRFRNFFSDRTEIGLGLSCEAVALQLMKKQDKTQLICIEDGSELLWDEECDFLDSRDDIIDILQNRQETIFTRLEKMAEYCGVTIEEIPFKQLSETYKNLERLDNSWDDYLSVMAESRFTSQEYEKIKSHSEIPLEQLAVYFIYRHLLDAFDDDHVAGCIHFVYHSIRVISCLFSDYFDKNNNITVEVMAEICRIYSSEIEYSDENMQSLFEIFEKE